MTPERVAGWSALVAAGATVVGAVTLEDVLGAPLVSGDLVVPSWNA